MSQHAWGFETFDMCMNEVSYASVKLISGEVMRDAQVEGAKMN